MPRRVHSGTVGGTRGPFAISRDGVNIPYRSATDLIVRRRDSANVWTILTYGVDFTLSGTADASGWVQAGSLTLTASQELVYDDERVDVRRAMPRVQETAYAQAGAFPSVATELMADRTVAYVQDLAAELELATTVSATDVAEVISASLELIDDTSVRVVGEYEFEADGVTTRFTIPDNIVDTESKVDVYVGGLRQPAGREGVYVGAYTVTVDGDDTHIDFGEAPPLTDPAIKIHALVSRLQGEVGPAGPPVADGDKGDITVSVGGSTWTIDAGAVTTAKIADDAITYAKMQNVSAASRVIGRGSAAGSGDPQEIALGAGLSMSGTTLVVTGALSMATRQTTGFTAVAGNIYPCDTTSAGFTATLPASPSQGDRVGFTDVGGTWNTNNLTIGRNSQTIIGDASDLVCNTQHAVVVLAFDATRGWRFAA